MKTYVDMSKEEVAEIVNRGGADLVRLNDMVAEYLRGMDGLSQDALDAIATTGIADMAEIWGNCKTKDEVEKFVTEYLAN